jgi:hypothetical protein
MTEHPTITPELLQEIVKSLSTEVAEKNQAYGSSFYAISDFILARTKSMTPEAVVEALPKILSLVRLMDKVCRLIVKPSAFGESPWRDLLGYALLAYADELHQQQTPINIEIGINYFIFNEGIYKCWYCNRHFSADDWLRYTKSEWPEHINSWVCPECQYINVMP